MMDANVSSWPLFFRQQYHLFQSKLYAMDIETSGILYEWDNIVGLCRSCMSTLREHISERPFAKTEEEIAFFKEIKPAFYTHYIYYFYLYNLELNTPPRDIQSQLEYLNREVLKIKLFFETHAYFYRYIRSAATHLDVVYFTRAGATDMRDADPLLVQCDPIFCTGADYLLANIQARELLSKNINERIFELLHPELSCLPQTHTQLRWTGSLVDLVELVYAMIASSSVNNGRVSYQFLANVLSSLFHIKIDNIYKKYEEMRLRKKNRTIFLDGMKRNLVRKMEEDDEHAL